MALWVDKHRPSTLDKLHYHKDLSTHLKKLAGSGDFPHMLFYGPSGAGKKTRVVATLRELFGPGVEKLKIDQRSFQAPSGRKLDLSVVTSNYHLELNPSDVGIYDRVIVQDLIKEVAQTQQVDTGAQKRFKVVVINEADSLTKDAQAGLRRTMEKYMTNLRIILVANNTGKLISPIRSRCLLVRVAAPTVEEMTVVVDYVSKKEGFKTPPGLSRRIAEQSKRNLRKALLMLEAAKVEDPNLEDSSKISLADWELFIEHVAQQILKEQSPNSLLEVRGKLYELLAHCIPPTVILKTLTFELIKRVDEEMKAEITKQAAIYEHRLRLGQKAIFHLEAFVARTMSVYKRYLCDGNG